jgi:hypothetical protein
MRVNPDFAATKTSIGSGGGCALANGGGKIRQSGGASAKGSARRFFYAFFSGHESNRMLDAGLHLVD